MKLYKGIIYSLGAAALLAGCAKEDPFVNGYEGPTGMLATRSIAPTLSNPEGLEVATRAAVPSADDFKVVITRQGGGRTGTNDPGEYEYTYSEMPEVLTLPTGNYKVYADYGDNKPCAWDEPYYYGESSFDIEANKVTDDVEPIVAKLSNIRVTITFSAQLLSEVGDDAKVEVKVGDQGSLDFMPSESRSAYFQYVNKSQTLTATFTGTIDGSPIIVTKAYDNVAPGNHYRINFKLHPIEDQNPGTVSGGVTVDATIERVDMNHTLTGEEQGYVEDDWRPTQGSTTNPEQPEQPTPPIGNVPTAVALDPKADPSGNYDNFKPIDLTKINEVTDDLYCAWKVISEAEGGFKSFTVDIISDTLTPDELEGVELTDHLDLVNPGQFKDALAGLGFPVEIGGQKEAEFNITGFLSLMGALGTANHEFKMTITDANGTSVVSLKLHTN